MHREEIKSHPERISNQTRFEDNYDWDGLEFPLPVKGIRELEKRNDISINVLGIDVIVNASGVEENKVYPLRRSKYESGKKVVNLLLIAEGEVNEDSKAVDRRHYRQLTFKNLRGVKMIP